MARWIERETGKSQVHNLIGWDYLKKLDYSSQRPRPKHRKGCPQAQTEFKENLPKKVKDIQKRYPHPQVDVLFFDEHRVGLRPILALVWSPCHQRPTAIVHHRYEWVYVYGFVNLKTGATHWYLIPRVNVQWLNVVFETLAKEVEVSDKKMILLVQERTRWHMSNKVCLPPGMIVEYLPPYSERVTTCRGVIEIGG